MGDLDRFKVGMRVSFVSPPRMMEHSRWQAAHGAVATVVLIDYETGEIVVDLDHVLPDAGWRDKQMPTNPGYWFEVVDTSSVASIEQFLGGANG